MISTANLLYEPARRKPWVVRWWGQPDPQTGKQKRFGRSFKHVREAKELLIEVQHELDESKPRDTPLDVTLGCLVAEFEEARLATLSYASQQGYRNTTSQLLEYFGRQRKLRTIEQRHAEAFLASRKRQDGRSEELSSWSRLRHLIHCRAIFATAGEWGYVERNPFQAARAGGNSPLRINAKSRPWHHLTPEEFARLLAVVENVRYRAAHWLMYGCGLRPGEVYNLMASSIDLEQQRVHVVNRAAATDVPPFKIKAEGQSTDTKERSVPIPDAALPDITDVIGLAFKSGGFVVLSPERFRLVQEHWQLCRERQPWGGHPWRPWQNRDMVNNLLRDTKVYLQKAGIELSAPFTLQTFRKSFAQNHADAGTPPRTLAKLLGHGSTRVTTQFYNQVTDANEQAAAEAMNRLLGNQQLSKDVV